MIRQATYEVLEQMPPGREFSSHELRSEVISRIRLVSGEEKRPFHDTVLRYLREKRHLGFVCTSRQRSTYKKVVS